MHARAKVLASTLFAGSSIVKVCCFIHLYNMDLLETSLTLQHILLIVYLREGCKLDFATWLELYFSEMILMAHDV